MMDVDRTIAILTITMLLLICVLTCIVESININVTKYNYSLTQYVTYGEVWVTLAINLPMFLLPVITALVAILKRSLVTRIIHTFIISAAIALALFVVAIQAPGNKTFTFQISSNDTVDLKSLCVSRDTKITNFALMFFGLLVLVSNLIYTGIVCCNLKVRKTRDERTDGEG